MCRSVRRPALALLLAAALLASGMAERPAPASASLLGSLGGAACKVIGTVGEGWWGTVCNGADKAAGVLGGPAGKTGKAVGAVAKVASNPLVQRAASLAAIVAWVLGGANWTISHIATAIGQTTSPALTAAWFSTVYLKVEAVAWLLTVPFLVAAAVQAVLRSEPGMLARVLFGYLPLAGLACALAVPITMLMLAATDSLSAGLVRLAGQNSTSFLSGTSAWVTAGLSLVDPFVAVLAGMVIATLGLALWTELIIRELAVYVVVAMLPLVFCAIVWPARRIWAVRTVELLIALVLAKLAIIVPLALGTAALAHSQTGGAAGRMLAGVALVAVGCMAPWLLLRLIPMAEVASAAVGQVRGQLHAHAGLRTPEAALTSKIQGHASDLADGVDLHELLRAMDRRAQQTQPTNDTPPTPNPAGGNVTDEDPGASAATQPSLFHQQPAAEPAAATTQVETASPTLQPRPSASAGAAGVAEPPTMVQQADGSWQPLRTGDPDSPVPPAPWECEPSVGTGETADAPELSSEPPPLDTPADEEGGR